MPATRQISNFSSRPQAPQPDPPDALLPCGAPSEERLSGRDGETSQQKASIAQTLEMLSL